MMWEQPLRLSSASSAEMLLRAEGPGLYILVHPIGTPFGAPSLRTQPLSGQHGSAEKSPFWVTSDNPGDPWARFG